MGNGPPGNWRAVPIDRIDHHYRGMNTSIKLRKIEEELRMIGLSVRLFISDKGIVVESKKTADRLIGKSELRKRGMMVAD